MKFSEAYTKRAITIIGVIFAIVLLWRGVWGLLDIYLFPDNLLWSYLISALVGVIILFFSKKIHLII